MFNKSLQKSLDNILGRSDSPIVVYSSAWPFFRAFEGSKNYTDILISQEEPSEIIIENNNHEIKSDNADEFITHKKKNDVTKRILSNLFVIIITFVAIIIVADTFKQNLSSLIPGLLPLLDNLYETLYDLQLFIKDLLN